MTYFRRVKVVLEDEFSDIVEKALSGLGIDRERLSSDTAIPRERLLAILSGKRPRREEVMAIARVLGLKADRLLAIAEGSYQPAPLPPEVDRRLVTIRGYIGGYEVKAYILFKGGDGILIDTACNPEAVLDALRERGITLRAIFLTHGHGDHTGGLERVLKECSVPVYRGRSLVDGQEVRAGGMLVRCLATPGHTQDSFSYLTDGVCLVGDTLFAGSIGRSNPPSLYPIHLRSIRERILTLPDPTILLPGHGPATTVGEERENNPFF